MPILSFRQRPDLHYGLVYVLSIIFIFHGALVLFVNSSYIETFVTPSLVGALFMIGSALAVLTFLFIARMLRRVGNVRLTLGVATLEIVALLVLGFAPTPELVIAAFTLFLICNPLLYLNLDVFSEALIGDAEETTGNKRGIVLALMSLAGMLAPLLIGPIAGPDDANLNHVYFVSAGFLSLFVLIVISRFRNFPDPTYSEVRVLDALASFWRDTNVRLSLLAQFLLQLAFAWFTIYVPLYLATEIGLSWSEIGIVIAAGTLAYVLLEAPAGYMADRYWGEQEMMATGFVILTTTVMAFSILTTSTVLVWMGVMFLSRVGASLVEVTVESYFFKHTKGTDTNFLSFFRLTRPLAFVAGGFLGSVSLLFLPFSSIFYVLGVVLASGVVLALHVVDTK